MNQVLCQLRHPWFFQCESYPSGAEELAAPLPCHPELIHQVLSCEYSWLEAAVLPVVAASGRQELSGHLSC